MRRSKHNTKLVKSILQLNLVSLLSTGCGGGNVENAEAENNDPIFDNTPLAKNASGTVILETGSVFVAESGGTLMLTPVRVIDGFSQANIIAQVIASDQGEEFSDLHGITVTEDNFIFGRMEDFSANGKASNIELDGSLWLYIDALRDEGTAVTLDILLNGKALIVDMANDDQIVRLSAGSALNLRGGSLRISDGTFDVSDARLISIKDIEINSSLRITIDQLSGISGQVTLNSIGTLNLVANTISDADMILEFLTGPTNINGLTVAIDSSNSGVCDYLDQTIIPAINAINELHSVSRISGPNDAPNEILAIPIAVAENTKGALVCEFFIRDSDVNDTHTISVSDERFVVIDNNIILAEGESLDFETQKDIDFIITATDSGGLSIQRTITLSILDINEQPDSLKIKIDRFEINENQNVASRLKIADLVIADDALGTIEYRIDGRDAAFFQIFGDRLYLKRGVTPDFSERSSLDITIIAFDPDLTEVPDLSLDFSLGILETNEHLDTAPANYATFNDNDGSSNYTFGDTIVISFNEEVDTETLSISDLQLQSGAWGNSTIRALNIDSNLASQFEILLGTTSTLPAEPVFVIDSGEIQDAFGRSNSNRIAFELPPTTDDFDIELVYQGNSTYQSIFQLAVNFWETVIVGDLPAVLGIDDLRIFATVETIDGEGGTLGYASWDRIRTTANKLPYKGSMTFDSADMRVMSNSEIFDVAVHEIAHILGFGTLWDEKGLTSGSNYIGVNAVSRYHSAGGQTLYIPLETSGGGGTAYSHWNEDIFGAELMTGYINSGQNYFSAITIGAIEDLGYQVDYSAAEPFSLDIPLLV